MQQSSTFPARVWNSVGSFITTRRFPLLQYFTDEMELGSGFLNSSTFPVDKLEFGTQWVPLLLQEGSLYSSTLLMKWNWGLGS